MKWRVMVELAGSDGTVFTYEISTGGTNAAECSAATVGLSLADGNGPLQDWRITWFRHRQRNIAGNDGSALIVDRNGRSKMSVRGGYPRCSERWRSERRGFCPADVR
jgi:hypothetical protein